MSARPLAAAFLATLLAGCAPTGNVAPSNAPVAAVEGVGRYAVGNARVLSLLDGRGVAHAHAVGRRVRQLLAHGGPRHGHGLVEPLHRQRVLRPHGEALGEEQRSERGGGSEDERDGEQPGAPVGVRHRGDQRRVEMSTGSMSA